MTTTVTPPEETEVLDTTALLGELGRSDDAPRHDIAPDDDEGPIEVPLRPLVIAAFSMLGTALTVGGIFGSWGARLVCLAAALVGIGWSWVCARSRDRRQALQMLLPVVALGLAVLSLTVGSSGGPSQLPSLVRDAIDAGRALRPPIPFDAGWRPILIVVMILLGFAAGTAGTTLDRPRLALVIPLPLLGLTAISQPKSGEALAGILAVVPVIAGLTVLFGDQGGVSGLTREFEFRRIVKAVVYLAGILAVIVMLNSTNVLFPAPAYDPAQQAQKPKPIPLSASEDRVLFEVDGPITGPWKVGSLDDYDGKTWRLPPFNPKSFVKVPGDGVIDKTRNGDVSVKFTVRDFGDNTNLPGVTGPTKIAVSGKKVVFDPRAGSFRVPSGRVPAGLTYTESLPKYPDQEALVGAGVSSNIDPVYKKIPKAPPAVRALLDEAPPEPWQRFDYLLKKLTAVEVAVGTGTPKDITPHKIETILVGNHEGSPFELVAAQAMLARWAGVPARIGFGFDGSQPEGGVNTVRPRNASQWLEVNITGRGWIPIITQPPKAKAQLDNDQAKFDPSIEAGADVAVQIYVPIKVHNFRAFYQQVRDILQTILPLLLLVGAGRLALPYGQKSLRRARRQSWAREQGPMAQVAVEYCELRDLATDLGIGDPYATPIEFLNFVVEDDEHAEFAWLVTKSLYGELRDDTSASDVAAARELGDSLRRRLFRAQPLQTRVLSYLTRLSLQQPYSKEVP